MKSNEATKGTRARRYIAGRPEDVQETLTVEAPLHIKVNGVSYTTTMRTPGEDEALVRGLLFTEGIVTDPDAGLVFRAVADPEAGHTACLDVTVSPNRVKKSVEGLRTTLSTSSCGVCGTRDPAEIEVYGPPLEAAAERKLDAADVPALLERMNANQPAFAGSGGSHAAAIFNANGTLLAVFEDIGRHNAVDKAVGCLLAESCLPEAAILLVSGRVSYEIVYKAYRAGIVFVLAVSAPSSMAVETAVRLGITLMAFCRDDRATVYSHAENVANATSEVRP